jgi:hypothetical protein
LLNTFLCPPILEQWAELEKRAGRKRKAKELTGEAKALAERSPEAQLARYTVDASALR